MNPPTQEEFEKWKPGNYKSGDTEAENLWNFLCSRDPKMSDYKTLCCCGKYAHTQKQCCSNEDTHWDCWTKNNIKNGRALTANIAILEENYFVMLRFVKNGNKLLPLKIKRPNRIRVAITDIAKVQP